MSTITSNPVLRSTRAELLRLRKWPAVWVTLGAWLALTAMFGYLFNYLSYTTGDASFADDGQSTDVAARRSCCPATSRTCWCRACRCSAGR